MTRPYPRPYPRLLLEIGTLFNGFLYYVNSITLPFQLVLATPSEKHNVRANFTVKQ